MSNQSVLRPRTAGIALPILLRNLFPAVGFAWSVRIYALIVLILLSVACILIKPRAALKTSGPMFRLSIFKDKVYSCWLFGKSLLSTGMDKILQGTKFSSSSLHVHGSCRICPTILYWRLCPCYRYRRQHGHLRSKYHEHSLSRWSFATFHSCRQVSFRALCVIFMKWLYSPASARFGPINVLIPSALATFTVAYCFQGVENQTGLIAIGICYCLMTSGE